MWPLLLAPLLGPAVAGAQPGSPELAPQLPYQVTTWEPSSGVNAVAQTPDGFLWLATKTGLQRFDGIAFRIFNRSSQPALPADEVRRLLVTREGILWLGMPHAGVLRWRGDRFDRFTRTDGLPSDEISALLEDAEGDLWVGTSQGVARRHRDQWRSYRQSDGLLDDNVITIFTHRDGQVRIETVGGVSRFVGGRLISEPLPPPGSAERGRIMLLEYLPPRAPPMDPDILQGHPFLVSRELCDRRGHLWLGTRGGIIQVGDKGSMARRYGASDGLIADAINTLFEDGDGDLWAATMGGGLSRLFRPRMLTLTRADGLGGDVPRCLTPAPDGSVWMTTTQGLSRWQGDQFSNFSPDPDSMLSHSLRTAAVAPDGSVWITTFGGPMAHFRAGHFQSFGPDRGFPVGWQPLS